MIIHGHRRYMLFGDERERKESISFRKKSWIFFPVSLQDKPGNPYTYSNALYHAIRSFGHCAQGGCQANEQYTTIVSIDCRTKKC